MDRRLRQRSRRGAGDVARGRSADRRVRDCRWRHPATLVAALPVAATQAPRAVGGRLAIPTAALDIAENIATWSALGANERRFTYPDNLVQPTIVSTFAWLKMLAYGVGLLSVAAVCLLAIARRKESALPIPRSDQPIAMREFPPPTDLGVCCSGGGIRAAAFALGALDQLEAAGVMDRHAGWPPFRAATTRRRHGRSPGPENESGHAAADVVDWLNAPISTASRHAIASCATAPAGSAARSSPPCSTSRSTSPCSPPSWPPWPGRSGG